MATDWKLVTHFAFLLVLVGCRAQPEDHTPASSVPGPQPVEPKLPPYKDVVHSMATARQELQQAYRGAAGSAAQVAVLHRARQRLYAGGCNEILPQWLGTPWDFHGTTQIPRQGEIACGYFVTTVLRDAGFRVQRARLAQQASELIIRSLTREGHIKRYSNTPIDRFVQSVRDWGQGLYVVGLDTHTGFILHDGKTVSFVHSSYKTPTMVIREDARQSPVLSSSKYRVLGKISADDALLIQWLTQEPIPTRTR